MTTFIDALRAQTNLATTENGAVTNQSALDPIVDFFSLAGAMRSRPDAAADLFEKAYQADRLTAVRTLFYLRDIRGGQGERDVFRAGLRRLDALLDADEGCVSERAWHNLLAAVGEYGRWDDLFALGVRGDVVEIIARQLTHDMIAFNLSPTEPVSLMAKWMPSENASSPATKKLARELRAKLEMTSEAYRKMISKLRGRIRLLEQQMSANQWGEIDYGKLPSLAHSKHVKAFKRHDAERYTSYLESVTKGEAKINVGTLYPYEIWYSAARGDVDYATAAWQNLPDYTNGTDALVIADVSDSMTWEDNARAMAVSVSLALYFAERNQGVFKDIFMTFSTQPQLVRVDPNLSLLDKMRTIASSPWGGSTNLMAAFRTILRAAALSNGMPPKVLYIISDMEFDKASGYADGETLFQQVKREYALAGFELPHVMFWNVNARNMQAPATIFDGSVSLVSGCSPSVFGMAVQGKSPRQLIDEVVNSARYEGITL